MESIGSYFLKILTLKIFMQILEMGFNDLQ